jgi:glycosyl transferase family 25
MRGTGYNGKMFIMEEFFKCVINLSERKDRRRDMEKQLGRIGWQAGFSDSVRPSDAGGFDSIGARGCFESHLNALRHAAISGCHTIIMEDDLNFCPDFPSKWQEAFGSLRERPWAICYPAHLLTLENRLSLLNPSEPVRCAHFIIFHRDHVGEILGHLETIFARPPGHPLGGPMHVDGAYSTIRNQNPTLTTYAFSPSLGFQRSSRSDIATLRLYDRMKLLRPVITSLRRLKTRRVNIGAIE